MLKGRVNRYGEPVISIQLILRNRPVSLTAVIDTGFNGYLSVPRRLLVGSKWLAIGTEKFEIATGALVEQKSISERFSLTANGVRSTALRPKRKTS